MTRGAAILITLLLGAGCMILTSSFESRFFSNFSLKDLVQRNESIGGLKCSAGGGDGGGISAGAGGVGAIGKGGSNFHKGESLSCLISEQFDEAKFIHALKESVEKDLGESKGKIVSSENPDANRFSFEYALENFKGRVEISGTRSPGNYYSLSAVVDEKNGVE